MFITLLDKFFEFNPELRLQKVKVKSSSLEIEGLMDRIETMINRGIQHLDVKSSTYYIDEEEEPYPFDDIMPLNLYTSNTLVSLKLSRSGLEDHGFVSLPCLKHMHLRKVRWVAPMTLEKLLSGCPVLEELTLLRDIRPDLEDLNGDLNGESEDLNRESVVMRVRSRSLKRFHVPPKRFSYRGRMEYILEIDAPGLEFMSLRADHFDRIVVNNLTSLFTIDLDIKFAFEYGTSLVPEDLSKRNEIHDFLAGITSVRHMIISQRTLKVLDRYSKVGPIPEFNNLSRLETVLTSSSLPFLHVLFESSLNLKHLIVEVGYSKEMDFLELTSVPEQYFLSALECVEIKEMSDWEKEEKHIASYFLENSVVLKKLILSFKDRAYPRPVTDSEIYEELSQVTKRSWECRIIIDYER